MSGGLFGCVCGPGVSCAVCMIDSKPVISFRTPTDLSYHTTDFCLRVCVQQAGRSAAGSAATGSETVCCSSLALLHWLSTSLCLKAAHSSTVRVSASRQLDRTVATSPTPAVSVLHMFCRLCQAAGCEILQGASASPRGKLFVFQGYWQMFFKETREQTDSQDGFVCSETERILNNNTTVWSETSTTLKPLLTQPFISWFIQSTSKIRRERIHLCKFMSGGERGPG